jgi:hypothetical protein
MELDIPAATELAETLNFLPTGRRSLTMGHGHPGDPSASRRN